MLSVRMPFDGSHLRVRVHIVNNDVARIVGDEDQRRWSREAIKPKYEFRSEMASGRYSTRKDLVK